MFAMLNKVLVLSQQKVLNWKEKYQKTGQPMSLARELSDLIAESMLACIFGYDIVNKVLPFV